MSTAPDERRTGSHRARIRAIVRRDVITLRSYQLKLYLGLVQSVVFVLSFFYIGRFVGQPDALSGLDAGYFEFALLGVIVTSVIGLAIGEFSANVGSEQRAGTLEMVLTTPTPLWDLLAGGVIVSLVLTGIEVVLLLVIGFGLLGAAPSVASLLWSVPLLSLTFLCFAAIGIAAAGIIIVIKRGDPLAGLVSQATGLLSGAYFPVTVLPGWVQPLAEIIPATHGLRGIRELTLEQAGPGAMVDDLVVLVAMAAVMLPTSIWIFARAVRSARRAGTLGAY